LRGPRLSVSVEATASVTNPKRARAPQSWGRGFGSTLGSHAIYVVVGDSLSPTSPLGDALDVFVRREDAERFIEEVRSDEPELAKPLRIEERELEAGGVN
jgi:hypothetical protein